MPTVNSANPGGLVPEEATSVLRRAQEIHEQTGLLLQPRPEIEELVRAAEEAGIARDATMQALRERLSLPAETLEEGTRTFAKCPDGAYYASRVVEVSGRKATVRFMSGGESLVDVTDLRPLSLPPGLRLQYHSPIYSMWTGGQVVRVNLEGGSITVNCWGQEETVPLEKVRLPRERAPIEYTDRARLTFVGLVSALVGTGIGAALMHFLSR